MRISSGYYPKGKLASRVIGFTGGDNQGIIGLEVEYEEILKGINGKILTTTDARGIEQNGIGDNYDRLQKRVEQIRKTGEGTYAFYPGNWYKLHTTLYGKLWKKLILQTAVLMILSMLYLMDYERIYKTQDLVLATTTGKKMMEKKMLAGTLCGLFYAGLLTVFTPLW